MKIYENALSLIGNTPLLRPVNFEKRICCSAKLYLKLEYLNPFGSVKDRAALYLVDEAEKSGKLKDGSVIIEPTSGNTGIGLAAVGVPRGYRVILVMPETMSVERRTLLKAYGAEIVLTPGNEGMNGAIKMAEKLASETENSFIPRQFDNPANAKAHFETTGPEIWNDTDGYIDAFVSAIGTGGTVTGTGRYLKTKNSNIKIIGVEPSDSPVLSGGKPGSHKLQGIGAGFVPEVLDVKLLDKIITVSTEEAYKCARELAKSEGILTGISSGAALAAAIKIANEFENIVVLLPDTGDRYLSTELYL